MKKTDTSLREMRLQQLTGNLFKGLITNLISLFLTGSILYEYIINDRTIIYLGLILFLNLIRLPYIIFAHKGQLNENSKITRIWIGGSHHLSTICWSLLILRLYPQLDSAHYLIFLILIQGMATGGMISLSASLPLSLIYINLLMLPMIYISSVASGSYENMNQVYVFSLYYLFLIYWAILLNKQVLNNFNLKKIQISTNEKLILNERRYRTIFKEAPTGIFYYDKDLVIQDCNSSFSSILKINEEALNDLDLKTLPDTRILSTLKSIINNEDGSYEGPYRSVHSKNDLWVALRTSPVIGSDGEVLGGVGIIEDFTERIRIQNKIEHQAYHDTLTDLPNRQLLRDRLEQALKSVQRHGHLGSLMFLDLDRFKLINDTLGHRAGDQLLIEVSRRLSNLLREEDTVARLGGDEFVVLLPNLDLSAEKVVKYTDFVCTKIHNALSDPISLDMQNVQTSTSIGVYVFTSDDDSADHILKSADTAMYDAKDLGRNRSSYYHSGMEENLKQRIVLEVELKEALKNNELSIYYQPIVETESGKIIAAESLLRWNHSEKGFISPEDIINAAESSNQILILGDWIITQVLRQFREWMDMGISDLEYLSINISMKQILQTGFADDMIRKIEESSVPPHMVVLEITESVLISDFDLTVAKIRTLRKQGIQFALDDFGTGYSSLSYLKKLPVDKLKIDRYFTHTLLTNHDDYVLIKTILSIAEYFNLSVITEGVEEQAQVDKLKEMGSPLYQGYLCSKPVPPQDFIKLLS